MLPKEKDKIVKEKGKGCSAIDYPFRDSGIVVVDTAHPDKR